jgi:hypothetical protein
MRHLAHQTNSKRPTSTNCLLQISLISPRYGGHASATAFVHTTNPACLTNTQADMCSRCLSVHHYHLSPLSRSRSGIILNPIVLVVVSGFCRAPCFKTVATTPVMAPASQQQGLSFSLGPVCQLRTLVVASHGSTAHRRCPPVGWETAGAYSSLSCYCGSHAQIASSLIISPVVDPSGRTQRPESTDLRAPLHARLLFAERSPRAQPLLSNSVFTSAQQVRLHVTSVPHYPMKNMFVVCWLSDVYYDGCMVRENHACTQLCSAEHSTAA